MKVKLAFYLSLLSLSSAVMPFEQFSWSGDGTVNSAVVDRNTGISGETGPGTAVRTTGGMLPGSTVDYISGLTGGTFRGQTTDLARLQGAVGSRTVAFDFRFEVIGGMADLQLRNTSADDGGEERFNQFQLTNFTGNVTGIRAVLRYDEYMAGRVGHGNPPQFFTSSHPMLSGISFQGSDAGSAFDTTISLKDVYTDNGSGSITSGTSLTPVASSSLGSTSAGQTTFAVENLSGSGWNLIRGYNSDGSRTTELGEAGVSRTYAKEIEFSVTYDGSATSLSATDKVQFSLDGQQYSNVSSIPEPASGLLLLGGLVSSLFFRKRGC